MWNINEHGQFVVELMFNFGEEELGTLVDGGAPLSLNLNEELSMVGPTARSSENSARRERNRNVCHVCQTT